MFFVNDQENRSGDCTWMQRGCQGDLDLRGCKRMIDDPVYFSQIFFSLKYCKFSQLPYTTVQMVHKIKYRFFDQSYINSRVTRRYVCLIFSFSYI